MSEPRRLAAIRRLYLAKLSEQPSDMSPERKEEAAKAELDKCLGSMWRDEIGDAGFGMDPIGDMEDRIDLLPGATRDAGFSGDDVQPPVEHKKSKPDAEDSILMKLMKFFHD